MRKGVHAGWRSRGYLPHYDAPAEAQHIVFRLYDSLPATLYERVRTAPAATWRAEVEGALDAGCGSRLLARPDVAEIAQRTLICDDGERYELLAWCVMPTHVHVLMLEVEGHPLSEVVQAWKSVSAHRVNRMLGRRGSLWAPEYFDRAMRSERQCEAACLYIEANPVTAGLCVNADDWPWSSAANASRAGEDARVPGMNPTAGWNGEDS